MDPLKIIDKYYADYPKAREFLVEHSRAVARKALKTARLVEYLKPDMRFVEEGAMLHDIGIFMIHAPVFGCFGREPYICHGFLGGRLLREEGLERHALVCERHVGVGLTAGDIREKGFPIPARDMVPQSLEEKIICFADKFFSKDGDPLKEKPLSRVRRQIAGYGEEKLKVFDEWLELFYGKNYPSSP